jgi:hypothetical protein
MLFTSTRLGLWLIGLLYVVVSLFGQPQYQTRVPAPPKETVVVENPVTETQIGDLARRVQILEENKTDTRLTKIETILEQGAKSAESNAALLRAILVPLGLLCMEAVFRLFTALPVLREITKKK